MVAGNDVLKGEEQTCVMLVDTGPLLEVVESDLFPSSPNTKLRFVTVDVLIIEAQLSGQLNESRLQTMIASGQMTVCETEVGRMYRAALSGDSEFRGGRAIDRLVVDWMLDFIDSTPHKLIVVYKNARSKHLLERHDHALADFAFTWPDFLNLMKQHGNDFKE